MAAPTSSSTATAAPTQANQPTNGGGGSTDGDAPRCSCGIPTKKLTCGKEGPNKGRPFWTCSGENGIGIKCDFFFPADGKPWIRGRKSKADGVFRPYKKFRMADPTIKAEYSARPEPEPVIEVNAKGMALLDALFEPGPKPGIRSPDTPTKIGITNLHIHPDMKMSRSSRHFDGGDFVVKKKPAKKKDDEPEPVSSGPTKRRQKPLGYKYDIASITNRTPTGEKKDVYLLYPSSDRRDRENIVVVKKFLDDLADNPIAAIEEMGRLAGSCCLCGRDLTDPRSISRGCGSTCDRMLDRVKELS